MATTPKMRTQAQEQAAYNFLRPSMIAERLDCDHEHVLNLIRLKKLEAINIGTGRRPEYRVAPEALEKFLGAAVVGA